MSVMPSLSQPLTHHQTSFDLAAARLGLSFSWLNQLQSKALEQFLERGLPKPRREPWKHTSFNFLRDTMFVSAPLPSAAQLSAVKNNYLNEYSPIPDSVDQDYLAVWINGHFCPVASKLPKISGCHVLSLSQAIQEFPQKMQAWLQEEPDNDLSFMERFNLAFLTDGIYFHLEEDVVLDKPLRCLFFSNSTEQPMLLQTRHYLEFGKNSSATIIEQHLSLDKETKHFNTLNHFESHVFKIVLNADAQLRRYVWDHQPFGFQYAMTQAQVHGNASFWQHRFTSGRQLSRDDLQIHLLGERARCELYGLFRLKEVQHHDQFIQVVHDRPNTHSDIYYKGALSEQATGAFNGQVRVKPQAQGVKSRQTNKNLLLSTEAEMNTKPELNIDAHEVQCTHGATVGQLDESALFYLRSRGMSQEQATQCLVQAFMQEMLDSIPDLSMRHWLLNFLGISSHGTLI